MSQTRQILSAMLACLYLSACLQEFLPQSTETSSQDPQTLPQNATNSDQAPTHPDPEQPREKKSPNIILGKEPALAKPKSDTGPFTEPPMEQRPLHTYSVIVKQSTQLSDLTESDKRLQTLPFLPIGYPAVDQASPILPGQKGFVLLAGKFARKNWAQTLAKAITKAGFQDVLVHTAPYRFDTNRPALNELTQIKAGRIFSGMVNTAVPLLAQPSPNAQGAGLMLADGTLVEVVDQKLQGRNLWYRITHGKNSGYLPAKRVLVDYNVFSETSDRFCVLGVSLGCLQGDCRWDYWLMGKNNTRRLLKSAGTRMPHAFSNQSRWLAYTTIKPTLKLTSLVDTKSIELGPGISPAFSPDGRWLYFRGPGVRKQRDQVFRIALGDIEKSDAKELVRTVLDFRGTPFYPRAIATIPPTVDTLEDGELFTLFFRVGEKRGQRQIQRWGVRFSPDGKILETAGALISK